MRLSSSQRPFLSCDFLLRRSLFLNCDFLLRSSLFLNCDFLLRSHFFLSCYFLLRSHFFLSCYFLLRRSLFLSRYFLLRRSLLLSWLLSNRFLLFFLRFCHFFKLAFNGSCFYSLGRFNQWIKNCCYSGKDFIDITCAFNGYIFALLLIIRNQWFSL